MRTDELDYELPAERIATAPAEPRDAARLMVIHRATGVIEHRHVRDLPTLGVLRAGDVMVVNRTRVLPAYFEATRSGTGGRVRGLYLRTDEAGDWHAMLESRGTLTAGETLTFAEGSTLTLVEPLGRGQWRGRLSSALTVPELLAKVGQPPLPPYIRKERRKALGNGGGAEFQQEDSERYNTVYAKEPGSVAAPTAGLHLTPAVLDDLAAAGVQRAEVVLHVGLGTFEPIRADTLAEHRMHREWLHVPAETVAALRAARERGGRVAPVGTTTVRALESLPADLNEAERGYTAETGIFIYPDAGHVFRFADAVMTNFHLPRSTLLAMIASLPGVGLPRLKAWYDVAIVEGYRFYSYGDAMLLA